MKIVAPKPVRARPVAFANYSLPKWIQTSPVKSELSEEVSLTESKTANETQERPDARALNFEVMPK